MGDPSPIDTVRQTSRIFIDEYVRGRTQEAQTASSAGMGALRQLVLDHRRKIDNGEINQTEKFGRYHLTTSEDIQRKVRTICDSASSPYRNEQRRLSTRDVANAIAHADPRIFGFRIDAGRRHILIIGVRSTNTHNGSWIAEFDVSELCEAIEKEIFS